MADKLVLALGLLALAGVGVAVLKGKTAPSPNPGTGTGNGSGSSSGNVKIPKDLKSQMLNAYWAYVAQTGQRPNDRGTWTTVMQQKVLPQVPTSAWGFVFDQAQGYQRQNSGNTASNQLLTEWLNQALGQ